MSPFEPPPSRFADIRILYLFSYIPVYNASYLCNRAVTTLKKSRECWHVLCASSLPCRFVLLHIGYYSPLNAENAICKIPSIAEYCITKYSLGKNYRQFICCNIWWCYNSPSHINNRKINLLLPSWLYFQLEGLKCSTWLYNYRSFQACLADRMSVTFLMFKKIHCSIFWVTNPFSRLHGHILKSNPELICLIGSMNVITLKPVNCEINESSLLYYTNKTEGLVCQ